MIMYSGAFGFLKVQNRIAPDSVFPNSVDPCDLVWNYLSDLLLRSVFSLLDTGPAKSSSKIIVADSEQIENKIVADSEQIFVFGIPMHPGDGASLRSIALETPKCSFSDKI